MRLLVSDVMQEHYPDLTARVRELFPEMWAAAREVEVIPWREEFQVADRNPEVIDELRFWNTLLEGGLITEEEYRNRVRNISGYAAKTMGVAFIEERQVSFREMPPDRHTLLHELGHVHFCVSDAIWSSAYGGAEILMWLGIEGRYCVREEHLVRYMALLGEALKGDYLGVAEEIVKKTASLFLDQIEPHFYTVCIAAGWLPNGVFAQGAMLQSLKDARWKRVKPLREDVVSFFQNLSSGLVMGDSFFVEYAKRLGVVGR